MLKNLIMGFFVLFCFGLISACQSEQVDSTSSLNEKKEITSFCFRFDYGEASASFEDERVISITLPSDQDVTKLVPTIEINGASINPPSGVAQDFTNPVKYVVSASDGSTAVYEVVVEKSKFMQKILELRAMITIIIIPVAVLFSFVGVGCLS